MWHQWRDMPVIPNSRKGGTAAVSAVTLLTGRVAPAKADIVIADFSQPTPATTLNVPGNGSPTASLVTPGVGDLGASRNVSLTVTSPNPPRSTSLTGSVGDGLFSAAFDFFSSGTAQI